jgi:hypothetical protein
LLSEYEKYIQQPPPPGATFDVMPNAADIAEFNPFKDLIMSPESTKSLRHRSTLLFNNFQNLYPPGEPRSTANLWTTSASQKTMTIVKIKADQVSSSLRHLYLLCKAATTTVCLCILKCSCGPDSSALPNAELVT